MNTLQSDWAVLEQYRDAVRRARTLPERFEAVLTYGGEAQRFVEAHHYELDAFIRAAAWRRAA